MQRKALAKPTKPTKRTPRRDPESATGRRAQSTKKPSSHKPTLGFRSRTTDDDAYILQLTESQLGAIHEQSFQEAFPRDQFLRYLQSGAPTFLIERDGKRIGYFSYLIGPDAKMHISAMVIEPQYQSDGIGTAVMERLEKDASMRGVQVLEVFVQTGNEQSLAFTRKLGFVEVYRVNPMTICFQKRLSLPQGTAIVSPLPGPFPVGQP